MLERRGWQGLEEVVRLLNGNEFAMAGRARRGAGREAVPGVGACHLLCPADGAPEEGAGGDAQRVVVAVFLGGCTFSEIAALRFLGKERGRTGRCGEGGAARPGGRGARGAVPPPGCRFIFLTTAITSSARMMEAMAEAKA